MLCHVLSLFQTHLYYNQLSVKTIIRVSEPHAVGCHLEVSEYCALTKTF